MTLFVYCHRTEFQSTPPRGERRYDGIKIAPMYVISIHAPARGATVLVRGFSNNYCDFNPRPREGSDLVCTCLRIPTREFQSTPPRGERHRLLPIDGSRHYFNPRPREGSDVGLGLIVDDPSQFQSTPPRGERLLSGIYALALAQFQSTPPRGERLFVPVNIRIP